MGTVVGNKSSDKPFELCPPGPQQAVCCDVIDHGVIPVKWGSQTKMRRKITIRWQSERLMADGRPYLVQRRFTGSLDTKSDLRKYLDNWRGVPMTEDQATHFDLDVLIGVNALISVQHIAKGQRGTFAEVMAIMPPPRSAPALIVRDYIRVRDQQPAPSSTTPPEPAADAPPDPDRPPF